MGGVWILAVIILSTCNLWSPVTSLNKDIVVPFRTKVRTVSAHYMRCLSEVGSNMSLMNSSGSFAFGVKVVWSKIRHDGNYTCQATNSSGHVSDSKSFHVSVVDKFICGDHLCKCDGGENRGFIRNLVKCPPTTNITTHLIGFIPTTTTDLFLNNNTIEAIDREAFQDLENLQYIVLSDNPIKTLGYHAFSIHREKLRIFLMRSNLTEFELTSFENSRDLLPVLNMVDKRIGIIDFRDRCIVHLGVQTDIERTDESEFIDITNFENTSFGNKLLEEFLHAGFADLKLGKYKPLPCWAGTHVGAGTNYACKECPAGGFYSDTVAFVNESCKRCPNRTYVDVRYAPGTNRTACVACPQGTAGQDTKGAKLRACSCLEDFFRRDMFDSCEACLKDFGVKCENDILSPKMGYWWKFLNDTNRKLYKNFTDNLAGEHPVVRGDVVSYSGPLPKPNLCISTRSCLGGPMSYCRDGHEGPLCDVCQPGFYKQLKLCHKCPSKEWMIGELCFMALVVILITTVVVWRNKTQNMEKQRRSLLDRILSRMKIIVGFYQVAFGVVSAFSYIEWPYALETFAEYSDLLRLHIFQIFPPHCIFPELKMNAFKRLYGMLIVNGGVVILAFLFYGLWRVLLAFESQKKKAKKISEAKQKVYTVVFVVFYITYLSTCSNTANINPLACYKVCYDNNETVCQWFLKGDFTVGCGKEDIEFRDYHFVGYLTFIYIAFLPTAAFVILWRQRQSLMLSVGQSSDTSTRSQKSSSSEVAIALRFLHENYRGDFWYWEFVETARKVALTSGIILIGKKSRAYIGVACTFSGLYGMYFAHAVPIVDRSEYTLMVFNLAATFFNLGIGTSSKIPAEEAKNLKKSFMNHMVFQVIVIAANFSVIGLLFVQYGQNTWLYFKQWRKTQERWSFSCLLAMFMPLGDLESELQEMEGKIPHKQQKQMSANPIMSSMSAIIRRITGIRLEFGNRDRLPNKGSRPPSINSDSGESETETEIDEMEQGNTDDVAPDIGQEMNKQSANFESGECETEEMKGRNTDDVAPDIGKELNKQSVNFESGELGETHEMEEENTDDLAPNIEKELNKQSVNFESGELGETHEMEEENTDDLAPDIGKELNKQSVNFESGELGETYEMEEGNTDDVAPDIGQEMNKQSANFESGESETDEMEEANNDDVAPDIGKELNEPDKKFFTSF